MPSSARREIVGADGATGISSLSTGCAGSGRVSARLSRSTVIARRVASARRIVPNLTTVWNTNAAVNTQAP